LGICKANQQFVFTASCKARRKIFIGKHFWYRGYCVNTVRIDEEAIREYVRNQEELDRKQEKLDFDQ